MLSKTQGGHVQPEVCEDSRVSVRASFLRTLTCATTRPWVPPFRSRSRSIIQVIRLLKSFDKNDLCQSVI